VLLAYLIGLTYIAKQENLGRVRSLWPLAFLAAPALYGSALAPVAPAVWPFLAVLGVWVLVALRFIRRRGPGDVPRAVVCLIAGISLLDAMLVAAADGGLLALACVGGFALTLVLQRLVAGT
jgi:4-hydroxybenzoate polyprenyltransferase